MTAGNEELHPGLDQPHVLREYALLADGERGVLVGPRGDFVWMCFPGWDGQGVFSSLIGGGGAYQVVPEGRFVWGGFYEPGTLIWRSRWITEDSVIECREALAMQGERHKAVILRRVVALQGVAEVRVMLNLRGEYGSEPVRNLKRSEEGHWTGRVSDARALWSGGENAKEEPDGHRGHALVTHLQVREGEHHDFVLVLDAQGHPDPVDADEAWQGTEAAWSEEVPRLEVEGAAERDARHAYAVLRGLTSSGGMVAAATTSLPERAQEGRSYDYRYVWIRDQCYTGQAVAKAGPLPLLDEATRFVAERLLDDGANLMPAYQDRGRSRPG